MSRSLLKRFAGAGQHYGARLRRFAVRTGDSLLAPLEPLWYRRFHDASPQPVFIIGAPRTGSTLLYQVLTSCWRTGYINNLMCSCPRAILSLATVSGALFASRGHSALQSYYGRTEGLNAPSECGELWYRWFARDPLYAGRGALPSPALAELRATVAALEHVTAKPFLFKNLYCSLRVGALADAFPRALFIWCRRDELDCARSIVLGRVRVSGSADRWWSTKPPEYPQLCDLSVAEQIAGQIYYVEEHIRSDLADNYPGPHLFTVQYERFCADPTSTLDALAAWLAAHGLPVTARQTAPASFAMASRALDDGALDAALEAAVRHRFPHPMRHSAMGHPPDVGDRSSA